MMLAALSSQLDTPEHTRAIADRVPLRLTVGPIVTSQAESCRLAMRKTHYVVLERTHTVADRVPLRLTV